MVAGVNPGRARKARLAELVERGRGAIHRSVIAHEYLDPVRKSAGRDSVAAVIRRRGLVQVERVNRAAATNVDERRRREGNVRGELPRSNSPV